MANPPALDWEPIENHIVDPARPGKSSDFVGLNTYRTPIPGGWLVMSKVVHGAALAFVPDPNHSWDGRSAR